MAVSVATPHALAQEPPPADSTAVTDRPIGISIGARLELYGVKSPGVIGQVTVTPGRMWVSMAVLAQMIRWTVQYDPHTRRDHLFLGRIAAGIGTGDGPSWFMFLEAGTGRIKREPSDYLRGTSYELRGIGFGAAYTVGRMTAAFDFSLGEANRNNPDLYGIAGFSLRWRVL